MDPLDVVALTRRLVDVESTTGQEAVVCAMVGEELERRGYAVTRQVVTDRRVNILATVGTPEVVFSTHMDCVPPFSPSRLEGERIHGRGSCDAKGILVSQLAASEALRAAGETRVGLLFVVGEERGSDGAMIADRLSTGVTRYLVNGEPTEGKLALGHRGVVRVKLHAKGRAAHSGYPHLGESAIEKLLDALAQVRAMDLPVDAVLGPTQVNIGAIAGGLAPNVIAPEATADLLFRIVTPHEQVMAALEPIRPLVDVEYVYHVPFLHMATLEGFESEVVGYTTDAPLLNAWGTRLMYGPGSIHVAHTDHESVAIADLHRAVDDYQRIARALLAS
ncbi:succinyl-diaminopimelate desuccinylase [Luteitalea sp. TBR-22]|uniref:M20/M25/M40 family metallo-hydrolase n=1 Tax=Luteitalea sp. TBR-22 TaxID=2802971 RepID=UPI001AF147E9|nr:M20/M25/M40 family metallo-hydrolase [Luteitalea sp. TBR-22]BCS35451.1 succinyl-diaminopimelate desuccinylase [Luteitalea sp. TBR-22]